MALAEFVILSGLLHGFVVFGRRGRVPGVGFQRHFLRLVDGFVMQITWTRPGCLSIITQVQHAIEHITEYMMAGVLVVVGVSQINRIAGSILGLTFWLAVAFIGQHAYNSGARLGFPGVPFSREAFFALCAAFVLINVVGLRFRLRARRDARERSSPSDT